MLARVSLPRHRVHRYSSLDGPDSRRVVDLLHRLLCSETSPAACAKASGVPIERMALAIGIPTGWTSGFAAGVIGDPGFRGGGRSLAGRRAAQRPASHSTPTIRLPGKVVKVRVGVRDVRLGDPWPPFYEDRQGEYLVEHDDVLFVVQGAHRPRAVRRFR